MSIDTDLITAREFDWIVNNEPTFQVRGRKFIGKVGKTPSGEDIRIAITLPTEFYPIVKPEVRILNNISHPNIDPDGSLALQLLDEWEPRYRIKDIISSVRRLFHRSRNAIKRSTEQGGIAQDRIKVPSTEIGKLTQEISELQQQIGSYTQQINKIKAEKLSEAGISVLPTKAIPISSEKDQNATLQAIEDFLEVIEIKFEEADMDEIAFFRLYRKYTREIYILRNRLQISGGIKSDIPEKKTERPIGS